MKPVSRTWLGAALWLGLSTLSAPSAAIVLSEDPLEGDSIDLGGAIRSYNFVLRGGPLTAPFVPADDNPASISIAAMRPKLEVKQGPLSFAVHDELTSTSSTVPTAALSSLIAIGQGATTPAWLPLQWTAVDRPNYQLTNRIDWLYARYHWESLAVTLGRQPVSMGRGQIWTPEDLLAPFSPLQLNTEFKPGVDALRLDWTLSETATLLLVGTLGKQNPTHDFEVGKDGSGALARGELSFDRLRIGGQAGVVRGDVVGGLDLFVDLGRGFDLHGEGTLTYVPDIERRVDGRKAFNRAVLGTTTALTSDLHVTAEAYFNGSGAAHPADYVTGFSSPRFTVGEVYNVGRLYAGVAADWQIHPLLHAVVSALSNLEDPSAILTPEFDYNVATNALLVAGAFIPLGKSPLYPGSSVVARSEFGLYPQLYHVDAKLYF